MVGGQGLWVGLGIGSIHVVYVSLFSLLHMVCYFVFLDTNCWSFISFTFPLFLFLLLFMRITVPISCILYHDFLHLELSRHSSILHSKPLKEFLYKYRPTIVFLIESKNQRVYMQRLQHQCGYPFSIFVDLVRTAGVCHYGGMTYFCWNHDFFPNIL